MSAALSVGLAGARGVLGRAILAALGRDPGLRVLPILRPRAALGPGVIAADLTDPSRCHAAALRCEVVVSAAGPAARVQPALVQACAQTGRPLLDVSGRAIDVPDVAAPLIFGCGVMPGWSELLPAMLLPGMAPGSSVEVGFAPGGALGRAGMADYLDAAARNPDRVGAALARGRRISVPASAERATYLSEEAERAFSDTAIAFFHAQTRTERIRGAVSDLTVTVTSPEGRTDRIETSAPGAAAYSVAALRICLRLLAEGGLPSGAVDFGALQVSALEVMKALAWAGVATSREAASDPLETGFI